MPDGRSTSSPFQARTDKDTDGYKYGKEKLVATTVTQNKRGGEDTERKYETKGTKYTPPKKTPEGDAKYAAMSKAERKKTDDKKKRESRKGKQFVENTDKAKKARKMASKKAKRSMK